MRSKVTKQQDALPAMAYLSLVLALASLLVLCIPFLGYAAILLSGAGVLLGCAGMYRAITHGEGNVGYTAGAVAASVLALALTCLPWVGP